MRWRHERRVRPIGAATGETKLRPRSQGFPTTTRGTRMMMNVKVVVESEDPNEPRTAAERVRCLYDLMARLRTMVADADRLVEQATYLWDEVSRGQEVWGSDPLVEVGALAAGGIVEDFARDARLAIEEIEDRHEEVEARLSGDWRPEWDHVSPVAPPAPEPARKFDQEAFEDFQLVRRLKALDRGAHKLIWEALRPFAVEPVSHDEGTRILSRLERALAERRAHGDRRRGLLEKLDRLEREQPGRLDELEASVERALSSRA
jgi:hypothetical protein